MVFCLDAFLLCKEVNETIQMINNSIIAFLQSFIVANIGGYHNVNDINTVLKESSVDCLCGRKELFGGD